ncbi:hypothetical protein AB4559_23405, partial [Vibrio sp. 10N.222.51.C8]|uniref:hypothetical protein n=1 Tax=Vibrio sp. 10N.222.51.C8 TaxID=3229624 RepID=UPI00354E3B4F
HLGIHLSFIIYVAISLVIIFNVASRGVLINLSFFVLTVQTLFLTFYVGDNRLSLVKCYFLFQFFFMALIPSIEFNSYHVYWGGAPFENNSYLLQNIVLFVCNLFAAFVYISVNCNYKNRSGDVFVQNNVSKLSVFGLFILSLLSIFFVLYVNSFSVVSLLVRAGEYKEFVDSSATITIMTYLGKFIPFFCLMAVLTVATKNKFLVAYFSIVLLICVFPLGNARFLVASIYLPIFIMLIPSILKGVKGISLFVFSLLILFPFIDNFRNYTDEQRINFIPKSEFFLEGHFDSYQSFLRVFENDVVTYGKQLLGVLLFFIPRVFWEEKPYGSGFYIAEKFHYGFKNVSMNFFGEGYINFGLVGVFSFVALLMSFLAILDKKFYLRYRSNTIDYISTFYLMLLGYVFFLLRGDLLSSFSFLVSSIVAFLLVKVIMNFSN